MTDIHYFQRYSQKENVNTNNTLLFLSRIQAHSSRLLRGVLAELLRDTALERDGFEVGVTFSQQMSAPSRTVPDGVLHQRGFRVVIETKLHPKFDRAQLEGHLSMFREDEANVLLLHAPDHDPETVKLDGVDVVRKRFSDVVAAARGLGLPDHHPLAEVIDDFEQFCVDSELISDEADRLMAVPVGRTLEDNRTLNLYYMPATRGYQPHSYIGLYSKGFIRAIGRVENRIIADLVGGQLNVHSSLRKATESQLGRVRAAILAAPGHGYEIANGHAFHLVESFVASEFQKTSPGGVQGKRYFNLRDQLSVANRGPLPDIENIARRLSALKWE